MFEWLANEPPHVRKQIVDALSEVERAEFEYHWPLFARDAQLAPNGDWRIWLILAGRGFGKTRAGAEWVREIAENNENARIALVSTSLGEARSVMIEGESGILACTPPDRRPNFETSLKRILWPNGSQAQLFSAAEPESLRGPQHSHAWCDEVGKWPVAKERATRCWDNLLMGLRLGNDPRITVTTTPRSVPLVKRILGDQKNGDVAVTKGSTFDNASNLPTRFLDAMETEYAGTQLARQEIAGEMLEDVEGALWTRALLEAARETENRQTCRRVVVAVDPPTSSHGDECGIIVAGLREDGIAQVLSDCTIANAAPDAWAKQVANAANDWDADRVIAEANQGGDMVESVLRAAERNLPVKLVHASRGKVARAEPVAALYASGRVKHVGSFPQLEDQMCAMLIGGDYVGPGRSPDRADALVWALTELCFAPSATPSVRPL